MTTKQRIKLKKQLRKDRAEEVAKLGRALKAHDHVGAEICRGQISMIDRELEEMD